MINAIDSSMSFEEGEVFLANFPKKRSCLPFTASTSIESISSMFLSSSFYQILSFTLPLIYSLEKETCREELIRRLVHDEIFVEPDAEKILIRMNEADFLRIFNFLKEVAKDIHRQIILSVTEGDDEEELLLIVCFDKESFEEVDHIMNHIFSLIENRKLAKVTAVEKFKCQHLTGINF